MNKSARLGLARHVQGFFEVELCGRYRFDQIKWLPREEAPRPEGWSTLRRPPFGKYREVVSVQFGLYDLTVFSPNERPPLGEILLVHPDGQETGPLDEQTWKRLGTFIRNREEQSHAA